MKTTKRKFISIIGMVIAIGMMCGILTGCGTQNEAESTTIPGESENVSELTETDSTESTEATEPKIIEEVVPDYFEVEVFSDDSREELRFRSEERYDSDFLYNVNYWFLVHDETGKVDVTLYYNDEFSNGIVDIELYLANNADLTDEYMYLLNAEGKEMASHDFEVLSHGGMLQIVGLERGIIYKLVVTHGIGGRYLAFFKISD